MSYQKAKNRSKRGHSHTQLWHTMHDSDAWRALSLSARCTWIEIMRRFNGFNNGEIPLSCREVADLCKISKGTASKAFNELLDKGFIKIGEDSAFNCKYKKSRRWIITHYPFKDRAPSNEWRNWKEKI